jgi:hypothetical protein
MPHVRMHLTVMVRKYVFRRQKSPFRRKTTRLLFLLVTQINEQMDLKNRFRNDSSSDIDYSVKTIWNTTAKLLQEKC